MDSSEILHVRAVANAGGVANCTYRRKKGGDTWHWCPDCSTWPTSDFEESAVKPKAGEFCNECWARQKAHASSR